VALGTYGRFIYLFVRRWAPLALGLGVKVGLGGSRRGLSLERRKSTRAGHVLRGDHGPRARPPWAYTLEPAVGSLL